MSNKENYYIDPKEFRASLRKFYESDILTDDLAENIKKIAYGLSYNGSFKDYCVDSETEVITTRGWLKFNEVTLKDKIMSYDTHAKDSCPSDIQDIHINNSYEGDMWYIQGKGIDAVVTPGHKFVTKQEDKPKIIEGIGWNDDIILRIHNTIKPCELSRIEKLPYKGVVWCLSTKLGNFYCRRNGVEYFTGNSYKDDMVGDALIKMYSALIRKKYSFDKRSVRTASLAECNPFSYFTTIAFNAFVNRIKREKRHHEAEKNYREKVYEDIMNDPKTCNNLVYVKPIGDQDDGFDEDL